jgi:hypothetical protein
VLGSAANCAAIPAGAVRCWHAAKPNVSNRPYSQNHLRWLLIMLLLMG